MGSTLIYGASYTIAKMVMPAYIGPEGFILVRVGCAMLLFLLYHRLWIREKVQQPRELLYIGICAAFGTAANMLFFFAGLNRTSPVNASLMMLTAPLMVFLVGWMLGREQPRWNSTLGILIGSAGAAMLIISSSASDAAADWRGDVLVLLNALSYAVYLILAKPLMKRYHPYTVMAYAFVFGLVIVLPFGAEQAIEARWTELTPELWGAVAFVVIGTTFLTYMLNAWALQHTTSTIVSSYMYLQPVCAIAIAATAGGYLLHWEQILFALPIFLGVWLVGKK